MLGFDPRNWWSFNRPGRNRAEQRARTRDVVHRWLVTVAFCFCFAMLAPPHLISVAFSALLFLAAVLTAVGAYLRGENPLAPSSHLTGWNEALFSLALSLAIAVLAPAEQSSLANLTDTSGAVQTGRIEP